MGTVGTRLERVEDRALLTTGGVYVEDLQVPELADAAWVTFVRSPLAKALIKRIDTAHVEQRPGVIAALTAKDLDLPPRSYGKIGDHDLAADDSPLIEPLLARDQVRYVGQPVALVISDNCYGGEDAAELVEVDYEALAAVIGIEAALAESALVHPASGSNIVMSQGEPADPRPFDRCEVVVRQALVNPRVAPVPLECRAAAASWADGRLTMWLSTQNAQLARTALAGQLGLHPQAVRVITPDVGGAFGAKGGIDNEALVVAWAARLIGRPLRWTETRSENLVAMTHGRAQRQMVTIGGSRDGKIMAYRLEVVQDAGAYARSKGSLPRLTVLMAGGPYDIPHVQAGYSVVVTNTTPIAPYRGAGRPEATAAIERAVDMFAARIDADPAEVRRKNFISADRIPYVSQTGAEYDSGDYAGALDQVLVAAGYRELRIEQERRRRNGEVLQLGIGLSSYVLITASDAKAGETARLVIHSDGSATVYTGSHAHGQGHHTTWAMVTETELGIPISAITVVHGDTDLVPVGIGTYGSRSVQLGAAAVHQAAAAVKDQARELAATMLEVSAATVELDTECGLWRARDARRGSASWAQLASRARGHELTATVNYGQARPTFPFGTHLAVAEVDTETGKARLLRHITVDDAGLIINPVVAEGQRHGGIAQGAAQALIEEVAYDRDGNPLTATLAHYPAISATELPAFELLSSQTPTDANVLGVKGIGESGTVGAAPAVQNAIIDAVSHLGVRHIDMPVTSARVWAAIRAARSARS
jgi:aerobic carbon-monoxide dehydrogenase large subunit